MVARPGRSRGSCSGTRPGPSDGQLDTSGASSEACDEGFLVEQGGRDPPVASQPLKTVGECTHGIERQIER